MWNYISLGIGVIGIIVGVISYYSSRRKVKLSFQYQDTAMLGSSDSAFSDAVTIMYEREEVSSVIRTRIILWNSGNVTLSGEQIAESDPLRIELEGEGKILRTEIKKQSRTANQFLVESSEGKKASLVKYDFMDPKDGVVLEILHTGQRNKLTLKGVVKGLFHGMEKVQGNSVQEDIYHTLLFSKKIEKIFKWAQLGLLVVLGFCASVLHLLYIYLNIESNLLFSTGVFIVMGLAVIFFFLWDIYDKRLRCPKGLLEE